MSDSQPTPERIQQIATGGWAAGILGVAASHCVFAHLENGFDTTGKLAERAGISGRGAQALLDGITGLGLAELRDGGYATPPRRPRSWSRAVPATSAASPRRCWRSPATGRRCQRWSAPVRR
jgi:hypothetical protein